MVLSRSAPLALPLRLQSADEFRRFQRRAEQRRLTCALVLALAVHASLLRLTFGGHAGLPGLDFRWLERRFEVPELRVNLLPKEVRPPDPPITPAAIESRPPPSEPAAAAATSLATVSIPSQLSAPPDRVSDATPALDPAPTVLALPPSERAVWVVPVPSELAASATAPRPEPRLAETVSLEAERRDVARVEAARREALDRAIGQPLDEGASRRAAAPRPSPSLAEAPRIEAARIEVPRIETRPIEAPRVAEAPRVEVPLVEAPRIEAPRIEVARVSPPAPAAVAPEEAEREARLRRLGQQLDQEAERRKAAADARHPSAASLDTYRSPRRYRLFGRADANEVLMRYAEAWSRKIEMNMTLDMVRDAVKLPHTKPLVTVAIRGDGSVESVSFVVSSGVAAIDQAIRQVVESQAPYAVFPPSLAIEYDVIEIRRTWHFDTAIRLD